MSRGLWVVVLAWSVIGLGGCGPTGAPPAGPDRLEFNRLAVRLDLPWFWVADRNANGVPDADEVVRLLFYPDGGSWEQGYRRILELARRPEPGADLPEAERRRRQRVIDDLDHGIPTLVYNDLRDLPGDHRALVRHMLEVAYRIDAIYARQTGMDRLETRLPDDPASHSLFRRNWGPACLAPKTQDDPACSAIPGAPRPVYGVYPAALQADEDFCRTLAARPDGEALLAPFVVVRGEGRELRAVPYSEAFAPQTRQVAAELRAAADDLRDPDEEALRAYLRAAARAFEDNDWEPADEAWAAMGPRNSRWYLRVGPDEVYWEPCARKAGFHLTFALINKGSLAWQNRLDPVRQEMEQALAALIGPPYEPREVSFQMPDFIDIVFNAGDDRNALGATIGQSLPNWGPVANEGRGRTVAMTNLYTDADSRRIQRAQAASLFDAATMEAYTDSVEPGLMATILHEATHNLGPSHEYLFEGKSDAEWFGGPLASILEELKAQTGALWYVEFLRARGLITDALARQTYVDSLRWAMDHISRGMVTATGHPKAYSQLAAIQVGFFLDQGALGFDLRAPAANGSDRGAFTVDFDKLPRAVEGLMLRVGRIKAGGDRAAAEKLVALYVDGDRLPLELIAERILRHPKASFVYAVDP
ncbi:MAG: hypothetical protein Q9Q13_14310 [Acidobacteriota bacterium]|nr:hypothetical protein [Acidobacteriota bacterium]